MPFDVVQLRAFLSAIPSAIDGWQTSAGQFLRQKFQELQQHLDPLYDWLCDNSKACWKTFWWLRLGLHPAQVLSVHDWAMFIGVAFSSITVIFFNMCMYWMTSYMVLMCILNCVEVMPIFCYFFFLPGTELEQFVSMQRIRQWSMKGKVVSFVFVGLAALQFACASVLNTERLLEVWGNATSGTGLKAFALWTFITLLVRGGSGLSLLFFISCIFRNDPQQVLLSNFQVDSPEFAAYHEYCRKVSSFFTKVVRVYLVVGYIFSFFILGYVVNGSWRKSILAKYHWSLIMLAANSLLTIMCIFYYTIGFNRRHHKLIRECLKQRDALWMQHPAVDEGTIRVWERALHILEDAPVIHVWEERPLTLMWLFTPIALHILAVVGYFTHIELFD